MQKSKLQLKIQNLENRRSNQKVPILETGVQCKDVRLQYKEDTWPMRDGIYDRGDESEKFGTEDLEDSNRTRKLMAYLTFAIFLASLLQVILSVGKVITQGKLVDFEVYYNYSKIFLSGGNPYVQNVPLNYPPSALLFFTPLPLLSQKTAEVVFTTLSIIALLASLYLLTKPLIKSLSLKLIIMALILQSFPTKFTLGMGQVNLFMLFFLVLTFINDQENKQVSSGIFWGMAMMTKLIPFPLIIYFVIGKKIKTVATGLTLLLLSNLGMLYFYPGMLKYFQTVLPYLTSPFGKGASIYDQSLRAFFMRLGLPQSYELSIFIGIILMILAVNKYRQDRHDLTFYSLILAITTIINSFSWQHHFVFLYPGFISSVILNSFQHPHKTLNQVQGDKIIIRKILLIISFLLISYHFPHPANPWTTNPILVSHTLIGRLIIIALLLGINFKTTLSCSLYDQPEGGNIRTFADRDGKVLRSK